LKSAHLRPTKFPLAEGVGIFVGILAWDLLSVGHPNLLKALLIAVPCALVWYGVRYWKHETEKQRR
jgi:arginine exporter protein ArgO